MSNNTVVQEFILNHLPKHKKTAKGWLSFCCPACIYNGEPSPDKKFRMGLKLGSDGSVNFSCFRCHTTGTWKPGYSINPKLKQLFGWMNIPDEDVSKLSFYCLKLKQNYVIEDKEEISLIFESKRVSLPNGSHSLEYWLSQKEIPEAFLKCLDYINSRNPHLIEWFDDFMWTKEMPEHMIMPSLYDTILYGWTARLCREPKKGEVKYYLNNESKFLFNADLLDDEYSKYLILVEGPLDAISLNGIAILGNQITEKQLDWLKKTNKEIIVLADKDAGGEKLVDCAIEQGWSVAFPDLEGLNCKDGLDIVNHFGRLFAIKYIIDSKVSSPLQIKIHRKSWFKS